MIVIIVAIFQVLLNTVVIILGYALLGAKENISLSARNSPGTTRKNQQQQ